ncbi:zinc-dependent metalloprotease, partial [Phytoactinopolyspora endophytica]|uniref:zinc-dependent metalloprotease n=1 Tax=Phytoactinopolyspora endophytica TaxID=1642495 RepID=UPI0013EC25F0
RAAGGPAEETFATLVGLQLRPRKLREAAALWAAAREARDVAGRDALWAHPDMMPSAEDLADPTAFLDRDNVVDVSELEDALRASEEESDAGDDSDGEAGEAGEAKE